MIPYEDLVAALTSWRQRNGLPTGGAEYVAAPPAFDVDVIAGDSELVTDASELEVEEEPLAVEEIYEVGEVDELEVEAAGSVDQDFSVAEHGDPHTFDEGAEAGYDDGAQAGYDDGAQAGYDDGAQAGYDDGAQAGYDDGAQTGYDDGANDAVAADAAPHAAYDEQLAHQDAAYADDAGAIAEEPVEAPADDSSGDDGFDASEATMVAQVGDVAELGDEETRVASDGADMDLGTLDDDSTSIGSLPTDDDDDRP